MPDEVRKEIMRLRSLVREADRIFKLLKSEEMTAEEAAKRWFEE